MPAYRTHQADQISGKHRNIEQGNRIVVEEDEVKISLFENVLSSC